MKEPTHPTLRKFNAILTLTLTVVLVAFVLTLATRVGAGLTELVEPEDAEAAPASTEAAITGTLEIAPTEVAPTPTVTSDPTGAPIDGSVEPTATELPATASLAPPTPTATEEPDPAPLTPTATAEPTRVRSTPTPAVPRLIIGDMGANVRRGPGTGYTKVGFLDPGTEVPVTGWSGDWWQVVYKGDIAYVSGDVVTAYDVDRVPEVPAVDLPGPTVDQPIFEPAPRWAIDEERWIDVDLSEQRVTAYKRQTPVKSYLVSTGLPWTPTPEGQFRIWIKLRYDDMAGPDYYLKDVPWVMYFYKGYGFHGVWWHANWGHPMSHGCINQPNDMAEWLFTFAEVGTLVNIHE